MPTSIDLQPIKARLERAPREQQAELYSWLINLLGPPGELDEEVARAWDEGRARSDAEIAPGKAILISQEEFTQRLRKSLEE